MQILGLSSIKTPQNPAREVFYFPAPRCKVATEFIATIAAWNLSMKPSTQRFSLKYYIFFALIFSTFGLSGADEERGPRDPSKNIAVPEPSLQDSGTPTHRAARPSLQPPGRPQRSRTLGRRSRRQEDASPRPAQRQRRFREQIAAATVRAAGSRLGPSADVSRISDRADLIDVITHRLGGRIFAGIPMTVLNRLNTRMLLIFAQFYILHTRGDLPYSDIHRKPHRRPPGPGGGSGVGVAF